MKQFFVKKCSGADTLLPQNCIGFKLNDNITWSLRNRTNMDCFAAFAMTNNAVVARSVVTKQSFIQ